MKYSAYYLGNSCISLYLLSYEYVCVQIILCFSVYLPLYRICSDSQVGTSSLCHKEGVDDVNEIIELNHNVEGMEEVPNLPRDILEALNRESEGSKPNIEETEVINLADEGEKENPSSSG